VDGGEWRDQERWMSVEVIQTYVPVTDQVYYHLMQKFHGPCRVYIILLYMGKIFQNVHK